MSHARPPQHTEFMLDSTFEVNSSDDSRASGCALRTLFEQEETALLRYAFSFVGRRAVAEEIVQEVFLQLHARWEEVESPRSWAFRTVRNRAFNYLRDNRRELLRGDDTSEQPTPHGETPDRLLQRMETLAALRNELAELSDKDQQLLRLKYFDDLSYREISQRTGLSISNVGYRLHHLLRSLAGKLRPLGNDDKS
ncbi:MAG: sigma-70 family RNA polymerase sigma factor [Pirellulaceae bacterium]|nr:sigma-70 family RNA polymerase sigma factor [Planctomycetales bacterium]